MLCAIANCGFFGLPPIALANPAARGKAAESPEITSVVQYLNDLKICRTGSHIFLFPFPADPPLRIENAIQGWQGDRCPIEMNILAPQGNEKRPYATCRYSRRTIALLTDEKGYREARIMDGGTGRITFDSSNPRDAALSEALGRECEFHDFS